MRRTRQKDISDRDIRQERQRKSDEESTREVQLLLKMIGQIQVPLCISVNFEEFPQAYMELFQGL